MFYRISEKTWTYNCVLNPLNLAGWTETKDSDYNLFWMGSADNKLLNSFSAFQKTNRFPGCWALGRKDNLWRNVSRMRRNNGKAFDFLPLTYVFPEDFKRFIFDRDASVKG